jgi:hypothetical protein
MTAGTYSLNPVGPVRMICLCQPRSRAPASQAYAWSRVSRTDEGRACGTLAPAWPMARRVYVCTVRMRIGTYDGTGDTPQPASIRMELGARTVAWLQNT